MALTLIGAVSRGDSTGPIKPGLRFIVVPTHINEQASAVLASGSAHVSEVATEGEDR